MCMCLNELNVSDCITKLPHKCFFFQDTYTNPFKIKDEATLGKPINNIFLICITYYVYKGQLSLVNL